MQKNEDPIFYVAGMMMGVIRWDGAVVAEYLRSNEDITPLMRHCLANLFAGDNPQGLKLKMTGQGNERTIFEGYLFYERAMKVGHFVAERIAKNVSREDALFDAAEEFDISESTAARDFEAYHYLKDM